MLRFVRYESPLERVLLSGELDYIRRCLELHKICTSNYL
jgi:hypothetical protein